MTQQALDLEAGGIDVLVVAEGDGAGTEIWTLLATWALGQFVPADPQTPSAARDSREKAAEWLRMIQNPDGGWGESCASYDDPNAKGVGPSTPSQTAWAVMGLLAASA